MASGSEPSPEREELEELCRKFTAVSEKNFITAEQAISADLAGMRIYDPPVLGVAAADDPLFESLRLPEVVGAHFIPPKVWLPEAASVISFFLPFSDAVLAANARHPSEPAPEWLHARWEGQMMLDALSGHLEGCLRRAGRPALAPGLDRRFRSNGAGNDVPAALSPALPAFSSNWSERHVAYVCGLGTFGLSAGLITMRGMAGRFGSLITALPLPPDKRPYTSHMEYCIRCGACARRCPAAAISLEQGKKHSLCAPFLGKTRERHDPRYGCGKCQVRVPCQRRIPSRAR
ncbi:MAG: 4Fe-4S binding protein [Deltaproteobacteria bacterium]|nr:4Fe-4S binding protein [Deltaproteobacteria bacterium]